MEEIFCDACKSEQTCDQFSAYVRLTQHKIPTDGKTTDELSIYLILLIQKNDLGKNE